MPELPRVAPIVPVVLVGTKIDLHEERAYMSDQRGAMAITSDQAKYASILEELGREVRVYKVSPDSANSVEASAASTSQNDEPDDFYDLTPEDYYNVIGDKMGAQFLKTRKIREAEAAARRARITKAVIKVRFPDGYILEAKFNPSETIQCLMDLLRKVVARQDMPFYIYTVPPKQRVKEMSKDFYSAGFAPGAIVYFSYDLSEGAEIAVRSAGPFLRDDIISLKDIMDHNIDKNTSKHSIEEAPVTPAESAPVAAEPKPASKTTKSKPKWFKM